MKKYIDPFNILFSVIIIYSFLLRIIGLNKGIWLDEFSSIDLIRSGNFLEALRNYDHPPLYFLILRFWSQISLDEAFLRLPSIVFGLLSIIIFMVWMKNYSNTASLIAGLMIGTFPIFIRYSQEIRGYALLIFGTVLSFYCAYMLLKEESRKWRLLLILSLIICVSTHLTGIFILPSIAIYLFFMYRAEKITVQRLLKIFKLLSTPLIIFLILYFLFLRNIDHDNFWMPALTLSLIRSQFEIVLGIQNIFIPAEFIRRYSHVIAEILRPLTNIFITMFFAAGIVLGKWKNSWVFLVSGLIYHLQIILISVFFVPIFWYRTIIVGLIPLIVFFSLKFTTINNRYLQKIMILAVVVFCLTLSSGWVYTEARTPYEPWREAAVELIRDFEEHSIIIFYPPYTEGPIRYYFDDLPQEQIITVDFNINLDEFKRDLDTKVAERENNDHTVVVKLILRPDMIYFNNIDSYNRIFDFLMDASNGFDRYHDFGTIRLYYFEIYY